MDEYGTFAKQVATDCKDPMLWSMTHVVVGGLAVISVISFSSSFERLRPKGD